MCVCVCVCAAVHSFNICYHLACLWCFVLRFVYVCQCIVIVLLFLALLINFFFVNENYFGDNWWCSVSDN